MSHNGHNPHDAIAARIVAGAMKASKLPPAAARAVRRALTAAGQKPPESTAAPKVEALAIDTPDPLAELAEAAGRRVGAQQEALIVSLAQVNTLIGDPLPGNIGDLGPRLQGFDYPEAGYREYELDGEPLIRFYPPEVAFEDGFMLVNLRYRIAT